MHTYTHTHALLHKTIYAVESKWKIPLTPSISFVLVSGVANEK